MRKTRILITAMEAAGPEVTRVFAFDTQTSRDFVQEVYGTPEEALKVLRKVFIIAKGSVTHY